MKTFPVRLEDKLHRAIKHAAVEAGMTLQEWIIKILKQEVKKGRYISNEDNLNETT